MAIDAARGSDSRSSNLRRVVAELEERRNALMMQHREISLSLQNYTNQLMEVTARIEEVTSSISNVMEELQQEEREEEEARRRHREELLRRRNQLEEGRAKARQWAEERKNRRRSG
jgi:hypothetical protein